MTDRLKARTSRIRRAHRQVASAVSVLGLVLSCAPPAGAACVPYGDDAGCFTTDPVASACEQKAAKNAEKLVRALLKCNLKQAAAAAKGVAFWAEPCELEAKGRFLGKAATDDCPCVYPAEIAEDIERMVDQDLNRSLFCMEACPPGQASVGGSCWVVGDPGASCDAACATFGQTCTDPTIAYVGSGGTDQNCSVVSRAVGHLGSAFAVSGCLDGMGCASAGGVLARCTSPATTCAAALPNHQRICACQ